MVGGVFVAGCMGIGAPAAPAVAQPEPAYVSYYFDEPRALTLDPTRVAVFSTGVRDVRGTDLGLGNAPVEHLPLFNAQLVELPQAQRSRAGVESILDDAGALRAESVGYVSPVFIGLDGGPVIPTPTVLVQFDAHADPAACEAALAKAGDIVERDWGGMPNSFRVATS